MSNVVRSPQLSEAEISDRKFASDLLRMAIVHYLKVYGETEPHKEEMLRKFVLNAAEELLGLTGRELPG